MNDAWLVDASYNSCFQIKRLLSPVILSKPDRRRRVGAVEGPRSDPGDHAASGSFNESAESRGEYNLTFHAGDHCLNLPGGL